MYLSRLRLNPADSRARRDLADAYEMHRTLARVYAAGPDEVPARFLWRQVLGASGWPDGTVLVQSDQAGRWDEFAAALPGHLQSLEADKPVDLTRLLGTEPGRPCRFRLVANPTVTREGKRRALLRPEEQSAWLVRQGERHGFELEGVACGASGRVPMRAGRSAGIVVHAVQFDGLLRVSDPAALATALRQGFGHAKAFGLGLMSLAPVRAEPR